MDYPRRKSLYRLLHNRCRLPRRAATLIVKGLTFGLDPLPAIRRRRAAAALVAADGQGLTVPEARGYRLFAPAELPGIPALLGACRRIFETARASGALDGRVEDSSKRFLIPVTENGCELLAVAAIRDFALSAPVLATAAHYFGRVPILSEVLLLWSGRNDTILKSQKFHLDTEDYRQLKLFVHVFEVTSDCGPLTLLPADRSAEMCHRTGYVGGRHARLSDEEIERAGGGGDTVRVLGPAGSGIFVDTSRCFHYGSRGNRRERLVLLLQFVDYYAPRLEPTDWRAMSAPLAGTLDEPRRLLLRC